jgi:nucleoid-associated protein YgaU
MPVGETARLSIDVGGSGNFEFTWSAEGGEITDKNKNVATYKAPETPGEDAVTVVVTDVGDAPIVRTMIIKVIKKASEAATALSAPILTPIPPTSTATVTPTPPGTSPSFQPLHRYTVKPGDTLPLIAKTFYEDQGQWYKIYEINRETLGQPFFESDPPPVRAGQILQMQNLPPEGLLHKVEPGDSLQRISSLYYGDAYRELQTRICEKNRNVIGTDCNRLSPGQLLTIPLLRPLPIRTILTRSGDTLWEISAAFYDDPTLSSLIYEQEDNKTMIGPEPSRLTGGLVLILPLLEPPVSVANYTVEAKDTLQTISDACYGSEEKDKDIYLANRDIIGYDSSLLQPGQKLKLYGCKQ